MRLRSRSGSIVLGVLGITYAMAALILLGVSIEIIGPFAGMKDYAAFLALVGAAGVGIWFILVSMASLHIEIHLPHFRRTHSGAARSATLQ